MAERYLVVENPDTTAAVDFLSHGVLVSHKIENGKLSIHVRSNLRPESSEWNVDDFEVILPKKD